MTAPAASPSRARLTVGLWLAGAALAAVVAARSHYVADLSAFLPSAPTAEQAVLLDQLQNGAASRLVLVGIEGGDATARADASRRLAAAMRASGRFDAVQNGENEGSAAFESAGRVVFANRYLLSPAVDAERFGVAGLRAAIAETVSLLGTPAGSRLKPILFADPTGETVRLVEALTPAQAPRSVGGVWASRRAERAVLVATTHADGGDLDGQAAALAGIRADFDRLAAPAGAASGSTPAGAVSGLSPAGAASGLSPTGAASSSSPFNTALRLELSGPGSFGVASRARIQAEVERLAIVGSVVMVGLLLVAFASLRALAVAVLPVLTGVLAGIAAVSLAFGQVHGMTLGFGTTLIGEAVDYAIYYLIQSRRPAVDADAQGATPGGAAGWIRHSWPTVRLGLFTSLIGFAALVFSGFPGLAQLGAFSVAGLGAAALTTRFVLPVLAPNGAPGVGLRRWLGRQTGRLCAALPAARRPLAAVAVAALVAVVVLPSPWRGELADLSPVGADALARDADLRADLGAADGGTLVAVSAASEGAALRAAEAVGARLDRLVGDGALAGYDSPARLLPSPATQAARRAALPDAATLRQRLAEATRDGDLPAERLAPFVADVEAARARPLLARADLAGTALAPALDALLLPGSTGRPWRALVNVQPPASGALDTARLRAAVAGVAGARVVAIRSELDALYARYVHEAMWQAALGAVAVIALLALALRDARRLVRVVEPIAAATAIVLAVLSAAGVALGILHLVGLLLTVAIGSNYALFFDHLRQAGRTDEDTLASLLLANATTVVSFGLLATSNIPVLRAIGEVVAPGTLLAFLLSAAFHRGLAMPERHGRIAPPRRP